MMCPPGTDQTTRSPQSWAVLCPRTRQKHHLVTGSGWHVNPLPADGLDWDVWLKLARPDPLGASMQPTTLQHHAVTEQQTILSKRRATRRAALTPASNRVTRAHPHGRQQPPRSKLENLPAEMQLIILSSLEPVSLIRLAQTCTSLNNVVTTYITHSRLASCAPWAGCEIAAIGTYLTTLPPSFEDQGLFYKSTNNEYLIQLEADQGKRTHWLPYQGTPAARVGNYTAHTQYEDCAAEPDSFYKDIAPRAKVAARTWPEALENAGRVEGISNTTWGAIERAAKAEHLFPTQARWALKNLDTREFLWCWARPTGKNGVMQGFIAAGDSKAAEDVSLDDFLFSKIHWPSTRNSSGWAGHRFEIVSERMHRLDPRFAFWIDVTETEFETRD